MVVAKKVETVAELKERFAKSELTILTDYRGLTVAEVTKLRRQLRDAGMEFQVAKNTLARFAAEEAGVSELSPLLVGPTAIAFGKGDAVQAAKAMTDYARGSKTLKIKGGVLEGRVIPPEQLVALAELPPREVLLARVVGGMQSPIVGLVSVLNGTLAGFVRVLHARQQQMEAGA
jgi:large subunit ribosomal protein L10